LRDGTDGTLERCSSVRQFSGEFFLPGRDWRQRMRSPPELEAVTDGRKEYFSGGVWTPEPGILNSGEKT